MFDNLPIRFPRAGKKKTSRRRTLRGGRPARRFSFENLERRVLLDGSALIAGDDPMQLPVADLLAAAAPVAVPHGLKVKTFNTHFSGAGHLNPISNLQGETPAGTHTLTGDLNYTDISPFMVSDYPSLTSFDSTSVLWEGAFEADESTTYSFGTESDDGSVIYLDRNEDGDFADAGELIVDNNGAHADQTVTGSVYLEEGFYEIAIGFYESGGGDTMRAKWAKGSGVAFGSQSFINGSTGPFYQETPPPQSVANMGVTGVTTTSATLNAEYEIPDGTLNVHAYWGTSDGGTDVNAWDDSALVGTYTDLTGSFSYLATGLTPSAGYYYTFGAVNAEIEIWGEPSISFQTGAVTVAATDPSATEGDLDPGEFTFSRPAGATGEPLVVNYAVGGTAQDGIDFQTLTGSVTIPQGSQTATVDVLPVDDWIAGEPVETVQVTIAAGSYPVGLPNTASVTITDNDVSPAEIAGLHLWLDADTDVLEAPGNQAENNDLVHYWEGISSQGRVATQDASADRPRYDSDGINAKAAVKFDGADVMAVDHAAGLDAGTGQTVFVLFSQTSGTSLVQKGGGDGLGAGQWLVTPTTYSVAGVYPQGLRDPNPGEVRLITGRYTGSEVQVFHNGVFQGEVPLTANVANTDALLLGMGLSEQLVGDVLIYNRSLSDAERSQVEGYVLGNYFGNVVFSDIKAPNATTVLDSVPVSAQIAPLVAGTDVLATLWYRQGTSGSFTGIPMANTSGDVYRTTTPIPADSRSTAQYYIQATYTGTTSGTAYWPHGGAASPASFTRSDADSRQAGPSNRMSGLIVSEIMYHPADPDGVGGIDPKDLEFIEIYNTEEVPNDLSRYELKGEVDFVFPEGTVLGGRSRVIVASNPAVAESFYGIGGMLGPYDNFLGNDGAEVRLHNQMGALLQEIDYSDNYPWPAAADGAGHSLVMTRPDYGENNVMAWQVSDHVGGNPGSANLTVANTYEGIVINEVVAHTDFPLEDMVELYNYSDRTVDLSGTILRDQTLSPDNTFVIPDNTFLGAGQFIAFTLSVAEANFSLSMHGDTIHLFNPADTRVIDAVQFGPQENAVHGVSLGRYPDGNPEFRVLSGITRAAPNATPANHDVVINEIMYHPISQDIADEFIELFNRGSTSVSLDNWQLNDGVRYTFAPGTTIAAGGYLVVAKDAARLIAANPGTLNTTNTVGDFSGNLSDRGERVVLSKPDDPALPDQDLVVVDEVWYTDGESWGTWADGGGSSLELIDPYSDNMRGTNWADSDETAKSQWTLIEHTGVLDHGRNAADEIQILLEGKGEALVDNVEVIWNGSNRVSNGTFESGSSGWIIRGTHINSFVTTEDSYAGNRSLHLVSSKTGDNGVNSVESNLTTSLSTNQTATIRARVRWLAGTPGILMRLHGNWLEAPGIMSIPTNLGSPGARNSQYATNAGPAIYDVTPLDVLPAAWQSVTITARVEDVDGIGSVYLKWRNDNLSSPAPGSRSYTTAAMNDNGVGVDEVAGDGIYSGTIPGQNTGHIVGFYVQATDAHAPSLSTVFPQTALTAGDEAHVIFGQTPETGTFGTYRFLMTEYDRAKWQSRQKMSDEAVHGTFIYGDFRVIYNAGGRYRGSPFIRQPHDPEGSEISYVFYVPKDDRVLNSTSFNLDKLEGDSSRQRERMSLWLADQVDTVFFYQRYVELYTNDRHNGTIYGDSHSPNDDYVTSWWPDADDGELFKIDDWFEFNDAAQVSMEFSDNGQIRQYLTTGGEKKQARYRWSWRKEPLVGFDDDYSDLYDLVDALNYDYRSAEFAAMAPALIDYDEWMHTFAIEHIINNWDSYGYNRGKNMSMYKPDGGQWNMIMWDLDHSHMSGSPTDNNLFSINDGVLRDEFFNFPLFRRAYWRAIYETATGPMAAENFDPMADANYAAFQNNGISVTSPDVDLKRWVADRRTWLLGQVAAVDVNTFQITTNGGNDLNTTQQVFTLGGAAPVEIKTFRLGGNEVAIDFNTVTNWQFQIGLTPGDNVLTLEGYDFKDNLIASDTITVTFTDTAVAPVGQIAINEIMYNPSVSNAEFLEIHNLSNSTPFDLSGWRIDGADFTFAPGSIINAGQYAVVVESVSGFAGTYDAPAAKVLGEYGGGLSNGGERLRLQMPAEGGLWTTIDEVTYDDLLPWPTDADGSGPSLQLVDPSKDNDWIGNWTVDATTLYTPGAVNSVDRALSAMPRIRINEILGNNAGTLADNMGDYDPWIELFDAGTQNVLAVELHQANPDGGDATMELSLEFSEPSGSEQVSLVEAGSIWKYLDDGSNQGRAWRALGYNDDSWDSGRARLGYGDASTTTLSYGPNSNDKYITYYFRHEFEVEDASLLTDLDLVVQRDDGIVVYLNGNAINDDNEVFRDHLPLGAVNYETEGIDGAVGGADETAWVGPPTVNLSYLLTGTNIITAEIHQDNPGSSDIGFDLELTGTRQILGSATEVVSPDATWQYLDDGSDQGTTWRESDFDDAAWSTGPGILGYGNGDQTTTLQGGHTTYYFRHTIDMQGATALNPLLNIRADDGAIVYLNGEEVYRVNMPEDPIDYTTRASVPVEGGSEADFNETPLNFGLFSIDAGLDNFDDLYLTDDYTNLTKWHFPSGVTLGGGEYLTVWVDGESNEQTAGDVHTGFAMDGLPGSLALVWNPDGTPIVVDYVDYAYTPDDQSSGRWPSGHGDLYPMASPTPEDVNSGPALGPVVINEIHYNPYEMDDDLEFIEIYNRSAATVNLWETYEATNYPWQLEGFQFPAATALAAGAVMLVVPFDPVAEPDKLIDFKIHYALETSSVQIVGGYGANLDNGGERLRLEYRIASPVAGLLPYLPNDEVRYDDEPAWPTSPDGTGDSLHRVSTAAWGNDAANWTAAPPNPGAFSDTNTPPYVVAEIVDVTADEDAPDTVLNLSTTFADDDPGDGLTLSVTGNTNPGLVATNVAATNLTLAYAEDRYGTVEITVRATDGEGVWVEDTFAVTVDPVDDDPRVSAPIANVEVEEGAISDQLNLSETFYDPDVPLDFLTLSVAGNSNPGLVGLNLVGTQLTLSYAAGQDGVAAIIVRATDSDLNWVEDTFTVTVTPSNHPPFIVVPIPDVTVDENAPDGILELSGTFDDLDLPGDTLSLSITGNTNPGLVTAGLIGTELTLSYAADQHGSADVTVSVMDLAGSWTSDVFAVTVRSVADVLDRHVFYNHSDFDGNDLLPTDDDDGAIATDKEVLLAGQTATFANYTSYSRGINGIMLDVADLPAGAMPTAADFMFRVGNDNDPSRADAGQSGWTTLDVEPAVTVRPGAGVAGSDRVTIVLPDDAVRNTWLEVTVKADSLGLAADDVFYVGNAVAETGNSAAQATVTTADLLLARNNPRGFPGLPDVTFPYDFDRDGQVDAVDVLLARNNQTSFLDALELIDLSTAEEAPAAPLADLAWLADLDQTATPARSASKDTDVEAVDLLLATYWP
ncbi:MAG: lamin tail domain-containing protein [Candidatus Nealsonbacteria bacterium]|nr:lamin tail domain-containing protein [Candidatus Nealsonbacteria bacterium]